MPPTCDWIKPLYDPVYDPLWKFCAENGIPVNAHSGTGGPVYQKAPAMPLVHFLEIPFYSQRPLAYMILGGVFERNPELQFVLTEAGCAWIPPFLKQMDDLMAGIRSNKVGEMRIDGELVPPKGAERLLPDELPRRHQPAGPGRPGRRPRATSSASTGSCGAATTRTRRAPGPTPVSTSARSWATSTR